MSFIIQIPCKSYSKHFLEMKYGDPVLLAEDKFLYKQLILNLERNSNRYNKRYESLAFSKYKGVVNIAIKRNDFYRLGWVLTRTEIVELNQAIEMKAKSFMYAYIAPRIAVGFKWNESIESFQNEFGFTEDIWSLEAIKKECQRNLNIERGELFKSILTIFNNEI